MFDLIGIHPASLVGNVRLRMYRGCTSVLLSCCEMYRHVMLYGKDGQPNNVFPFAAALDVKRTSAFESTALFSFGMITLDEPIVNVAEANLVVHWRWNIACG